MNKLLLASAVTASVLFVSACEQQQPADSEASGTGELTLDTPTERLSYGVALGLGRNMKKDGMEVDIEAFAAGLSDAMTGAEQRLSAEEIQGEMLAFQEKIDEERNAQRESQAAENAAASAAFLASNAERGEVTVTESGLQYEIVEAGDGPMPGAEDSVEVHYRGTLIDGTEFDSSYKRGQPVTFGVTQVIPGWTEALQLMPVGSKWKLYIPSDLAYGAGGAGNRIGPNAALVFDVELLAIAGSEAEEDGAEAAGSAEG